MIFKTLTGEPVYALMSDTGKRKVSKRELARDAKAAGEKYFIADCKKHGEGVEHITSHRNCVLCKAERAKQWHQENRERNLERIKQSYQENREQRLEYNKQYRKANYQRELEYNKQYRKDNAAYIFARSVLQRLDSDKQEAFSGITKAEAESLCGYSQVEFILHIESTFKDGMSWENRSEWHIDHVLPVAWFKEQGISDVRLINSLNNLEAMPAKENLSKGAMFMGNRISEQSYFDWLQISEGVDWSDVKKAG